MRLLLVLVALLAACRAPDSYGIQVLIGGKLIDGKGGAPIEPSVVIVEAGKFRAVGAQASTPIPPASVKVDTAGQTLRPPSGKVIEAGGTADLEVLDTTGAVVRRMANGEWK